MREGAARFEGQDSRECYQIAACALALVAEDDLNNRGNGDGAYEHATRMLSIASSLDTCMGSSHQLILTKEFLLLFIMPRLARGAYSRGNVQLPCLPTYILVRLFTEFWASKVYVVEHAKTFTRGPSLHFRAILDTLHIRGC